MIPDEHKQAHEVQLIGWGEHCTTGPWIKFRVDAEAYERFKQFNAEGKNQQRFHLVAVPIADNEQPLETKPRKLFEDLSRGQQAGILCSDANFHAFLEQNYDRAYRGYNGDVVKIVRWICQVRSRTELNEGKPATIWDNLVRHYRESNQLPEQRPGQQQEGG